MTLQAQIEKNTILFVDDDPQALKIGRFLEKYGFIFKLTTDPKEALDLVAQNNLDLVMLDLMMSPMDGVELTEQIKRIKPHLPVVVFSAYLRDSFWKGRLNNAQGNFEATFEKPFPVAEARIDDFCRSLKEIINKHKIEKSDPSTAALPQQLENPFAFSFQSYLKLDQKTTQQIRRRAWKLKKDWFLNGVKEKGWNWVVLCGESVVKTSLQGVPPPTEDELAAYGNDFDRIPFLFVRPPVIEEVGWSRINRQHLDSKTDDYYPTIACSVESVPGQLYDLQGDLDTGAFVSCISSDVVPVSNLGTLHSNEHMSEEYWYTVKWIKFILQDEHNKQAHVNLPVYVILDWQTSPFVKVNPQRQLLVGRDILNCLNLRVIFDSSQQKTFIEF